MTACACEDRLLTTEELAAETGIPAETLAGYRWRGGGPAYIRIGKHVRYDPADVRDWLGTLRVQPAPAETYPAPRTRRRRRLRAA